MAAIGFQNTDVNVRVTGTSVSVPNNCYAKLMYYLQCVHDCTPGLIPASLRDYQRHFLLDMDDKRSVVSLARRLSPELLDDVIFFNCEDMDSNNEFLEVSVARRTITGVATSGGTVLIGGRNVKVSSIMLYTVVWMRRNYTEPLASAVGDLAFEACSIM